MGAVLVTLLLILVGAAAIVAGIYMTLGAGPCLIALGVCALIAAFITANGAANA